MWFIFIPLKFQDSELPGFDEQTVSVAIIAFTWGLPFLASILTKKTLKVILLW